MGETNQAPFKLIAVTGLLRWRLKHTMKGIGIFLYIRKHKGRMRKRQRQFAVGKRRDVASRLCVCCICTKPKVRHEIDSGHDCQSIIAPARIEVFEHLVNPLQEIREMLRYSDSILFSTMLVPSPPPPLNNWWYYGLEHGQHVSLYSLESLKHIAQELSLTLHTNYGSIHLLTRKEIPAFCFKWIFDPRTRLLRGFLNRIKARPSLLQPDYERLTRKPMI